MFFICFSLKNAFYFRTFVGKMKTKLLVVFFLLWAPSLWAQDPFHRVYDTRFMIPSSEAYDGIQDDDGYLWFSCDHGLVRFDGYQFRNYEIKDGLPENSVFNFRKDDKGRIWVNSYGGKLAYIEKGQIIPYAYNVVLDSFLQAESMTNNTVYVSYWIDKQQQAHIYMKKAGEVLIDSAGHLTTNKQPDHHNLHVMFDQWGKAFFMGPGDLMYDSAVIHLNGKKWSFSLESIRQENKVSRNLFAVQIGEKVLLGFQYSAFLVGRKGIEKIFNSPHYLTTAQIDLRGNIWLLTIGGGVYITDQKLNLLHQYFKDESFSGFVQDHEGGIWLSSLNKGFFYIPTTDHFSISPENGFPNQTITTIAADNSGQLWIAYNNGQIVVTKNGNIKKMDIGLKPFERINEMLFDPCRKRILIATNMRILHTSTHQIHFHQIHSPVEKWKNGYGIKSMSFDEQNCMVWLGYFDAFSNLPALECPDAKKSIERDINERVESISAGENGMVWVGTSSGLYCFDGDSVQFYGGRSPMLRDRIVALKTRGDTLWIGTKGYGLLMLAGDSLRQFSKKDGLPSNSVKSIAFYKQFVLVGTNEGLAQLELSKTGAPLGHIRHRGYREIISREIEKIVVSGNTVFLATKIGISILLNPDKPEPDFEMPLHIREIYVENRPIKKTDHLRLPFKSNNITFEFFGISLIKTGKLTYRHRLLGLEKDWVIDQQIVAQYPFLPPGSYRFEVEVQHPDGHWSQQPASFSFVVAKPYWREWWFLMLIGLALLLLMHFIAQIYIKYKSRQERMLNDINRYQQDALVSQMNPHFMFNALNTVQRYILENDKTSSSRYLSVFARLMRRILEQAQLPKSSLINEQELLRLYIEMEVARFSSRFEYNIITDPRIDMEKTQVPVFLIQPLVENAIKHGLMNSHKPGKLELRFLVENENDLVCEVVDNGIGRIAAMEISKTLEKTSLGLSILQKRIVLLNQRSDSSISINYIDLYDDDGQPTGTRVILRFPNTVIINNENE